MSRDCTDVVRYIFFREVNGRLGGTTEMLILWLWIKDILTLK
jgi:hypothetical protein